MLDDIPDTAARARAAQAHEPGTRSSENAIDLAQYLVRVCRKFQNVRQNH